MTTSSTLIDLTALNLEKSDVTKERLIAMAMLHLYYLDTMADSSLPLAYVAFMNSVLYPDDQFMALQVISRDTGRFDGGEVINVTSEEAGKKAKLKFNEEYDVGGSTDGGAIVFKNGYLVGSYSYNGRLWSNVHFGGRQPSEIDKFIKPELGLVDFYIKEMNVY